MARIHGRNGRLYAEVVAAAAATPVPGVAGYDFSLATDFVETTSMGDGNKTWVSGLPDFSGTYTGFFDDTAAAQFFAAAIAGTARKFYLYPSTSTPGQYFYGTAFFDTKIAGAVGAAVTVSGNIKPNATVTPVGF